jgi:hypothetical protein
MPGQWWYPQESRGETLREARQIVAGRLQTATPQGAVGGVRCVPRAATRKAGREMQAC